MTEQDDFEHGQGPEFDEEWVSKTQIKRQVHELKALGEKLLELNAQQQAKVPMSDELRAALEEATRIKPRSNAMKRHLGYIGRLMQTEDVDQIRQTMERFEAGKQAHTALFHKLERWRDQLIAGGNDVLQAYLAEYPQADIQHLRQLIRNAKKEADKQQPPASARKLFKYLRELADV